MLALLVYDGKATILVTLSWDTPFCTHILTKSRAPPLPVLIFLLLTCQLEKTNIEGAENATIVSTNATSILVKVARTDLYACWLFF